MEKVETHGQWKNIDPHGHRQIHMDTQGHTLHTWPWEHTDTYRQTLTHIMDIRGQLGQAIKCYTYLVKI